MALETKTPDQMNLEELSAAVDAASKTATGEPVQKSVEPEEIVITLATGQVYKGKTKDEVIEKVKSAQEHASIALRERELQIRDLQSKLEAQIKPPVGDGGFDKQRYFKMLEEDPLAASRYLDGYREDYKQVYATVDRVSKLMETAQFHQNNPEYPADDKSASETLFNRMNTDDKPWTAENLEVTFHKLVREGAIKAVAAKEEELPPKVKPTPSIGGVGAQATSGIDEQIDRMSDKELEEFLRKKGLL